MPSDMSPGVLTFTLKMVQQADMAAGVGRAKKYRKGIGLLAEVAVSNISHRSYTSESFQEGQRSRDTFPVCNPLEQHTQ